MFEFDEHFMELEAGESETAALESQDQNILPIWAYLGHDIWKLDLEADTLQISHEWQLQIIDVA